MLVTDVNVSISPNVLQYFGSSLLICLKDEHLQKTSSISYPSSPDQINNLYIERRSLAVQNFQVLRLAFALIMVSVLLNSTASDYKAILFAGVTMMAK